MSIEENPIYFPINYFLSYLIKREFKIRLLYVFNEYAFIAYFLPHIPIINYKFTFFSLFFFFVFIISLKLMLVQR